MDWLPLLIIPALLLVAGIFDLITMTIPNWISGLMIVSFFTFALVLKMPASEILQCLAVALAVLLLGMAMFNFGWIGGGDAKLMAATALWMGWAYVPAFLLGVCLVGGAVTLALIGARTIPLPKKISRISWIARLHSAEEGVPYGIAISVAGIVLISDTSLFERLAG